MDIPSTDKKNFVIAKRLLDEEEDSVMLEPVYVVLNAPETTEVNDIKDIFEKTGATYYFTDDRSTPAPDRVWREYKVIPRDEWTFHKWNPDTLDGLSFAESSEDYYLAAKGDSGAILYDALVARISDERRMTLRIPVGLHVALTRAASEMTLNAFCVMTLAHAIGYSDLPEFEAKRAVQRRKPGRPKKVQSSE